MAFSSLLGRRASTCARLLLSLAIGLAWGARASAEAPRRQSCLTAYAAAQQARARGALLHAREHLLVCSQNGCPGPVVNDCTGWLSEVDNNLSSVVFAVGDEQGRDLTDARVSTSDGRVLTERTDGRALLLDPGSYTLSFEAPGYVGVRQVVAMRQSEKNRIVRIQLKKAGAAEDPPARSTVVVTPELGAAAELRAAPSKSIPIASYVLGGVALAGLSTFGYFGVHGLSNKRAADRCQIDCRGIIDAGKRDYLIADVGLVIGGLGAAWAVLAYVLTDEDDQTARERGSLELQLDPGAARLRWSGSF